ncbi:hypothetical protein OSB04_001727 [Centaurea solstitialis]|uniref:Reverse transcriptase Ty1/copia-type domain-containing protein n=1 Tax=Centaurea solstitialis TaxID=347529 RepID=A0AA38WV19_9ASTR|nr:hypothetical protein OSB04_001727 [Centaurea solstitialis]
MVTKWVPKAIVSDTAASESSVITASNQGRRSSLWHVDSGCSRHMIGIMLLLEDFKRFEGGHVAFGDNPKGGKKSGKGKVSKGFKIDESQVMLRTPRKDNVYYLDIEDASSSSSLNCLFFKSILITGSSTEKIQEASPPFVMFLMPSMDPINLCTSDDMEPVQEKEDESAEKSDDQQTEEDTTTVSTTISPSSEVKPLEPQEPKKALDVMKDPSWIEAMQEELLQFVLQHVWDLVDLPRGHRVIGTKWIFRNKIDERGICYQEQSQISSSGRNSDLRGARHFFAARALLRGASHLFRGASLTKSASEIFRNILLPYLLKILLLEEVICLREQENRLRSQEISEFPKYTQEEGIDYDDVFAPVARIEAIRLFLAFASYKGFKVYQVDVKSAFSMAKLMKRYDIIFGSTKEEMCKAFEELMHKKFKMSSMGELTFFLGLQVKQKSDGIFINQSKYVASMLQKFGMNDVKPASTPMENHKHLTADVEGEEVDVHNYRSMIGSLMYLTASRPDIMFVVCVCARYQVRPKESHLHAVKRIFKYLKGQPRLGLWYTNDSSFDLVAYTDSDYGGANLDRKSTSSGCQFLGGRLVSWQCKKQTTVSQSTTEAEYIAASQCCSQVLWIQNQMLDYGLSFLQTPIYIDNNSAISIVNNPVKHSKTKHIEIKYHFIRDRNEKKLIQILKVHTDDQFADLFTKAFDVGRFTFLVTSVGMINSE